MLTIVSDLLLTDCFLIKGNVENKYTRLSQLLDEHRKYFVRVRDATRLVGLPGSVVGLALRRARLADDVLTVDFA